MDELSDHARERIEQRIEHNARPTPPQSIQISFAGEPLVCPACGSADWRETEPIPGEEPGTFTQAFVCLKCKPQPIV